MKTMKNNDLMTMEQLRLAVDEARKARKRLAKERAVKILEKYYSESVGGSVLDDYRAGNAKTIGC